MSSRNHYIRLLYRPFAEQTKRIKQTKYEPGIAYLFQIIPIREQAHFLEIAHGDKLSFIKMLQRAFPNDSSGTEYGAKNK